MSGAALCCVFRLLGIFAARTERIYGKSMYVLSIEWNTFMLVHLVRNVCAHLCMHLCCVGISQFDVFIFST